MVHYIDKTLHIKNRKGFIEKPEKEQLGFFTKKLVEFCERTDLHGYKYIVMKDLNWFERSCWALAVLLSTVFAAYFVVTAYKWYARNPIVTVIESTQGAIWDIPFPAVTICNLNVISRKAAHQFADTVVLPVNVSTDEVFEALRYAPLLHTTFAPLPEQKKKLYMLQSVLELNSVSIEDMFRRLSPASTCSQLVQHCMWKNTIYRCETLFQQVFTYFAVCCSFNYFATYNTKNNNEGEWSGSGDVSKGAQEDMDTPRRVASCGYQTALTVLLNTHPDDYYSASVASKGALVFIDDAYNVADLDSPVRLVNPSTEVLIALSPERTYTTPGIRAFKPRDRQCYYSDEITGQVRVGLAPRGFCIITFTSEGKNRKPSICCYNQNITIFVSIGNFRQYSFHNCMAYQRVEFIKTACDCVPYFFPLKDYHRTCNFNDLDCLEVFLGPVQNESHSTSRGNEFTCLPECEHYDYPLEIALGKLTHNVRLHGLPFFSDVHIENHSLLNVFFNDLVSTRYRRDVYLNWQNLLASFGGLLSLMLGFTLISGFDLVLFFTFSLAYETIARHKSQQNQRASSNKPFKGRIYVQEYNKNIDSNMKLKQGGLEIRKWRSEVQFGVPHPTKRY